jgi:phosphate-selective porin OprO/OprP
MIAALVVTGPGVSFAASKSSSVDDRLRALEAEIEQLKRERAQQAEEPPVSEPQVKNIIDETLKKQKVLAGWQDGFYLQSQNGDFKFKLRGYTQADARFFPDTDGDTGNDTFYLRRVRPMFEGTLYKWFNFRIMPDFGGGQTVLQDAYMDVTYLPYASLRAGKFKEPYSLERLQSGTELLFVERSIAQNIAPNRDVGVQLFGDIGAGVFQYQLGIFDGVQDAARRTTRATATKTSPAASSHNPPRSGHRRARESRLRSPARTATAPTTTAQSTSAPPAVRASTATPTTRSRVRGIEWRIAPQAYWFWGPFGFMGEYYKSEGHIKGTVGTGDKAQIRSAKENTDGWFVQGSWVLTGEEASYKMVTPINNFDRSTVVGGVRGRGPCQRPEHRRRRARRRSRDGHQGRVGLHGRPELVLQPGLQDPIQLRAHRVRRQAGVLWEQPESRRRTPDSLPDRVLKEGSEQSCCRQDRVTARVVLLRGGSFAMQSGGASSTRSKDASPLAWGRASFAEARRLRRGGRGRRALGLPATSRIRGVLRTLSDARKSSGTLGLPGSGLGGRRSRRRAGRTWGSFERAAKSRFQVSF